MTVHTLIIGGAKSGKTRLGLEMAQDTAANPVYLATAQALDGEMEVRIRRHQAERGPHWRTLEEPLDIVGALKGADTPGGAVLVDCLTLWLTNLMTGAELGEEEIRGRVEELALFLPQMQARVLLVSNEVGLGIVPENRLARDFRDLAGGMNQRLAAACPGVVFVAAGLPLWLKGGPSHHDVRS